MEHFLALDIGDKRTGVAYADEESGIPVPLATLKHASAGALARQVASLIAERSITWLVVGLPFLPSGVEGAQAKRVRDTVAAFHVPAIVRVEFFDERYTTPRGIHIDPDASAACSLLLTYLHRFGAKVKGKEGS